jgi:phosphoribosylformimino-5-aminoimidazole carboxamide ribotide isomerase
MQLIPAIDLKDGCCVRLHRGDYDAVRRYHAKPRPLLENYHTLGAAWVHVVDLDGARDGSMANAGIIRDLAGAGGPLLQVGGGLRDEAAVSGLFSMGVARCVIGSAAITDMPLVRAWLKTFGADRIVLALDVRLDPGGTPRVATHGWQSQSTLSLWEAIAPYLDAGLRHVLCTDIGRDGTLAGPNLALYQEAAQRFAHIEWQASGGIRHGADLSALAGAGAAAAISGRALLEDRITAAEMRPFLPNA